jgi:hypothetical protein
MGKQIAHAAAIVRLTAFQTRTFMRFSSANQMNDQRSRFYRSQTSESPDLLRKVAGDGCSHSSTKINTRRNGREHKFFNELPPNKQQGPMKKVVKRCNQLPLVRIVSAHVQCPHQAARFPLYLLLQKRDRIQELLRTGWASGNIDIHWNHLVDALHQRVVVEYPT